MSTWYEKLGVLAFWLSWPASWVYLYGSRRTRLLLLCGDEILVVHGWLSTGKWMLPGGGLHRHEDPLAGLLREVKEETGVVVDPKDVSHMATEPFRHIGFRYMAHYFVARVPKPDAVPRPQPFEITRAEWQKLAEISSDTHGPDVLRALQLLDA